MSIVKSITRLVSSTTRRIAKGLCADILDEAVSGIVDTDEVIAAVKDTTAWKKFEEVKKKGNQKLRKIMGREEVGEEEKKA